MKKQGEYSVQEEIIAAVESAPQEAQVHISSASVFR
jgi:hypothetical protein